VWQLIITKQQNPNFELISPSHQISPFGSWTKNNKARNIFKTLIPQNTYNNIGTLFHIQLIK